jgi:hypothetical protein
MTTRKITALFALPIICASVSWGIDPGEAEKAVEEADRLEAEILETLEQDSTWEPSAYQEKLEPCLSVIKRYRLKGVIAVLVEHTDFSPRGDMLEKSRVPIEVEFPVVEALVVIGLPAVPELLDLLSEVDVQSANGGRKQALALYCMLKIYEQAGYGAELRKRTIELRIAEASGEKKERLLKVLEHPVMKLGK